MFQYNQDYNLTDLASKVIVLTYKDHIVFRVSAIYIINYSIRKGEEQNMHKLFIVDDEINVLNSLKNNINWQKVQCKVIGCALNGIKALTDIKNEPPDIIMTDIVMPGMDGIELIKCTREIGINVRIVVLSAYDEFKYAQKAINYGISSYLLKPFDDDEIYQTFKHINKEIKNNENIIIPKEEHNLEKNDIITEAKIIIKQNIGQDMCLNEIAHSLFINPSYLSFLFTNKTGQTFTEYVNYVRIERAKELLRASRNRVKEIAIMVGYDNYTYFCQVFRKITGMTPLEYRACSLSM